MDGVEKGRVLPEFLVAILEELNKRFPHGWSYEALERALPPGCLAYHGFKCPTDRDSPMRRDYLMRQAGQRYDDGVLSPAFVRALGIPDVSLATTGEFYFRTGVWTFVDLDWLICCMEANSVLSLRQETPSYCGVRRRARDGKYLSYIDGPGQDSTLSRAKDLYPDMPGWRSPKFLQT